MLDQGHWTPSHGRGHLAFTITSRQIYFLLIFLLFLTNWLLITSIPVRLPKFAGPSFVYGYALLMLTSEGKSSQIALTVHSYLACYQNSPLPLVEMRWVDRQDRALQRLHADSGIPSPERSDWFPPFGLSIRAFPGHCLGKELVLVCISGVPGL